MIADGDSAYKRGRHLAILGPPEGGLLSGTSAFEAQLLDGTIGEAAA